MLSNIQSLKRRLEQVVTCKAQQGHDTAGLLTEIKRAPDGYDAVAELSRRISDLPMRSDWNYVEPNQLQDILEQCASDRPTKPVSHVDAQSITPRVEAAFLSAVSGCMLGKPLEVNPTLGEIRKAAEACGEWPLRDYISDSLLEALGRRHGDAWETTRDRIQYVAPDDDINYTVLGMMVLEKHGPSFTQSELMDLWLKNLPPLWTWGPERSLLVRAALASLDPGEKRDPGQWVSEWNPSDEACGAAIRVDAYGYAAAGHPALAAELAWRDSSMTHRRTGIYGSMFVAAAIATAFVADDPLEIFETALKYVPQRSRFYETMADCFDIVCRANDWLHGYEQIHKKYGEYGHCQLYQECGLLMNSARFASDVGDAICKQVAQGCDTDCFGEIIGSIMGAFFPPGNLEERWLLPFHDDLRTSLGTFHDKSLRSVARRMAKLPELVRKEHE
mgnify:FL=1